MKFDRIILIVTAVIMLVIGLVWWITIQDGKRLLTCDRTSGVHASESTSSRE